MSLPLPAYRPILLTNSNTNTNYMCYLTGYDLWPLMVRPEERDISEEGLPLMTNDVPSNIYE
jgi:hypothetical protein